MNALLLTPRLETIRRRTILATVAFSVVTVTLLRDRPWSDGRTALALNLATGAIFAVHLVRYRDAALARLMLFGLAFGIVELVADALCVRFTGTLDYSVAHSPMLGLSPVWMPTAWMVVAVQIGFLGAWLIEGLGLWRGILLTATLGAINIPFYEEMAFHAHWWRYGQCRMLGHTPVYIIVAELLIGASLGPLARRVLSDDTAWQSAARLGALGGLGTIIGGLLGYGLVERVF